MSTDSVPTAPLSRREVWLQIALAVAKGMPEPSILRFNDTAPIISLSVDDAAAAQRWAEWVGATASEPTEMTLWWMANRDYGGRYGHSWHITTPRRPALEPTDTEMALATELVAVCEPAPMAVAAAFLTPDAPALDYVSGDLGDR